MLLVRFKFFLEIPLQSTEKDYPDGISYSYFAELLDEVKELSCSSNEKLEYTVCKVL